MRALAALALTAIALLGTAAGAAAAPPDDLSDDPRPERPPARAAEPLPGRGDDPRRGAADPGREEGADPPRGHEIASAARPSRGRARWVAGDRTARRRTRRRDARPPRLPEHAGPGAPAPLGRRRGAVGRPDRRAAGGRPAGGAGRPPGRRRGGHSARAPTCPRGSSRATRADRAAAHQRPRRFGLALDESASIGTPVETSASAPAALRRARPGHPRAGHPAGGARPHRPPRGRPAAAPGDPC